MTATGVFVVAAVLVLAGAAFGMSSLLGSSSPGPRSTPPSPLASATGTATAPTVPTTPNPSPQTNPQTATSPQTSQVATTPMVNWLGMEIATQPPGAAVVQTVQIGSPADQAGINPGEVIQSINGRPIHSAQDIAGALSGLTRGDRVTLQLVYGSSSSQAQLTLGAPPSVAP